jgi:uncharacterized protein YdaU (DUF1376 family)
VASSKKLRWYAWYPAAFRDETLGWTLRQRAVYRELLDRNWELGRLPPGPQQLRAEINATPQDWKAAWPLLEPLFPRGADGFRRHARLEEQRLHALDVSNRRSQAGRQGGIEKAAKAKPEGDGNCRTNGLANAKAHP